MIFLMLRSTQDEAVGEVAGGEAHFTGTEPVRARRAPASCLAKYTRARLDEPNVVRTWRGPKVQKALFTVFTLEHSVSETRAKHRAGTTPDHFDHAAEAKSGVVPAQFNVLPASKFFVAHCATSSSSQPSRHR